MRLQVNSLNQTHMMAKVLAELLVQSQPLPLLLLDGDLGAGKTTLVRFLVSSLPGGEQAEVSSPSFNILNIYPTQPEVAHFDLYRLQGPPEDFWADILEDENRLRIVEWAKYLNPAQYPNHVQIKIKLQKNLRIFHFTSLDKDSILLGQIQNRLKEHKLWT